MVSAVGRTLYVYIPKLDPILVMLAGHESLEVIPAPESWRSVLDVWRKMLQQTHRDVAVGEAQPLEQEAACRSNAQLVRAPCLHSILGKFLNVGQTFCCGFVKVLALFNLLKDPWLDQGTTTDHDGIDVRVVQMVVVVFMGVAVAIADEIDVAAIGLIARISFANSVDSCVLLLS